MFNKIEQVQRQYTHAIQPVKLFEAENYKHTQKSPFNPFSKEQTNFSEYSLFHPNVSNSKVGSKLDLMS